MMGAYAVGDAPDLIDLLDEHVVPDRSFSPDPEMTVLYRRMFEARERIIEGAAERVFPAASPLRRL